MNQRETDILIPRVAVEGGEPRGSEKAVGSSREAARMFLASSGGDSG